MSVEGKVVIVTGAAKGMGAVHARVLAERGAAVVLADNDPAGEDVAAALRGSGRAAEFRPLDVRREDDWAALVEAVEGRHGRIDVLVNNAGILVREPLDELGADSFDRLFAVNVRGTFLGCKAVAPAMRRAGGGSIINIGSMSAYVANMPGMVGYCATKGAVRMLTKALAVDLVDSKIRVNTIHPGAVRTPLSETYFNDPELRALVLGTTLMKRPGEPEEISEALVFLASDASSFMTGADMLIDGGFTAV